MAERNRPYRLVFRRATAGFVLGGVLGLAGCVQPPVAVYQPAPVVPHRNTTATTQSQVMWIGPGEKGVAAGNLESRRVGQPQAVRQQVEAERVRVESAKLEQQRRLYEEQSRQIRQLQESDAQQVESFKRLEEELRQQQAKSTEQRQLIETQSEELKKLLQERDRLVEEKKREEEAWAAQQAEIARRRALEQQQAEQWKLQEEKRLADARAELESKRRQMEAAAAKEAGAQASAAAREAAMVREAAERQAARTLANGREFEKKPSSASPSITPPIARVEATALSDRSAVAKMLLDWSRSRCEYESLTRQYEELDRVYNSKSPDGQVRTAEQLRQITAKLAELQSQMRAASKQSIEQLLKLSSVDSSARDAAAKELLKDPATPKEVGQQIATLVGN